jgi:DNA-binding transcriptional MerR regulator
VAQSAQSRLQLAGGQKLYTIGQVINQLDGDYPGLSSSKLRFLEDEGLVTPQRTSSGYRKYTSDDIERLRIILELQNRKLPLKVILEYLSQLDAGVSASLPGDQEAPELVLRKLRARKISRLELTAETGITEAMIAEAQDLKLLGAEPFDFSALEISRALVNLRRFGITPRHLHGHKTLIDREIAIIEGVVAPVQSRRDGAARAKAADYAREIEQQFDTIRAELINGFIAKIEK